MVHRGIGNWVGFGVVVVGIFRVDIGRVVKDAIQTGNGEKTHQLGLSLSDFKERDDEDDDDDLGLGGSKSNVVTRTSTPCEAHKHISNQAGKKIVLG